MGCLRRLDRATASSTFSDAPAGETNTFFAPTGTANPRRDRPSGTGAAHLPFTGFGVRRSTSEHDGDLDLVVVNGD